jgi:hypothetical protein
MKPDGRSSNSSVGRDHSNRKCFTTNLACPDSGQRGTQVYFGKGSKKDPHVIELEAGLDSADFEEDLPVAPWV